MFGRLLCVLASIVSFSTAQIRFDEMFNSSLVPRFNEQFKGKDMYDVQLKLGAIAYYARLRRAYARTMTGERFSIKKFPDVPGTLNQKLMDTCTKDIHKCINSVHESIKDRYQEIFDSDTDLGIPVNAALFQNNHLDKMSSFDTTFTYIFCFFSHNKLLPLELIPYCHIGPDGEEQAPRRIRHEDVSVKWEDYQCAIESFCPDPCCGKARYRHEKRCRSICKNVPGVAKDAKCNLPSEENSYLNGMITNKWNMSCGCTKSGFRFDYGAKQCVDIDECTENSWNFCSKVHEVCVNTIGSHMCVCKMGSRRINGKCTEFKSLPVTTWYGLAHSATGRSVVDIGMAAIHLSSPPDLFSVNPATMCDAPQSDGSLSPLLLRTLLEREKNLEKLELMKGNGLVTANDRGKQARWICSAARKIGASISTLGLAISIFDRTLCAARVQLKYVNCVAVTSLYLSLKLTAEEVDDEVGVDSERLLEDLQLAYSTTELVRMERTILHRLNFDLSLSTLDRFLHAMLDVIGWPNILISNVLRHGFETVLSDWDVCSKYRPATLALGMLSLLMDQRTGQSGKITEALQQIFNIEKHELRLCRKDVRSLLTATFISTSNKFANVLSAHCDSGAVAGMTLHCGPSRKRSHAMAKRASIAEIVQD